MKRLAWLAAAALLGCGPAVVKDAELTVRLVRGDADPLHDPGGGTRSSSAVGSLRFDFTVEGMSETRVVALTGGSSLDVRFVPSKRTGRASVQVLGLRTDDGLVYSAARTAELVLDGGSGELSAFFGPADALTAVGPALSGPRLEPALAALGNTGALIVGGASSGTDAGSTAAAPGLLVYQVASARTCGAAEGCLSGDLPEPRTGAIATATPSGAVLHGLGRLGDGGFDDRLWLTGADGVTTRLTVTGDPLPGVFAAQSVLLDDGTVLIAGGEAATGISHAIFHVNPTSGRSTLQTAMLLDARRSGGAAVLANGQVLFAGGISPAGPLDTAEVYTPGQASERLDGAGFPLARRNLKGPRVRPQLVRLSDDAVVILGGELEQPEVFRRDLGNTVGGLVDMQAPPAALTQLTAAAVRLGTGQLFVVGGERAGQMPVAALFAPQPGQVFDTSHPAYEGTWRAAGAGLNLRARAAAVTLSDGSALVVGGAIDGEPVAPGATAANRVEVLVPGPIE